MNTAQTDRGRSSFADGARLWHLDAAMLRSRGLSPTTITSDVTSLLELVHAADDVVVVSVVDVRPAVGPFTIHYRVADAGGGRTQDFMLVGQVTHEAELSDDASGYIVNLTAQLSRVADEAVSANNESRAVIEQAKGAFMMAYGITEEEAFSVLVSLSSRTNTKLRDVTAKVVSLMNEPEYRELHCSQTLLNVSQRVLARAPR